MKKKNPSKKRTARQELRLGEFRPRIDARFHSWISTGFARRLWNRDASLWSGCSKPEISGRLGWLDLPKTKPERVGEMTAFADEVRSDGLSRIVLLGMGGSTLAAEVFQNVFGNKPGFPSLTVLDSTHPKAVLDLDQETDYERTLFLVSSKSGTTLETLSFLRYFWARADRETKTPGRHFAAITDPGTPLEKLSRQKNFRKAFIAPPDVGGRYSALAEFGLVPAALIGIDIRGLLDRARAAAGNDAFGSREDGDSSFLLGAALGEMAGCRDKLTILTSPRLCRFPDWLEQLIAESTGKEGKGIVPIVHEPFIPVDSYGDDRVFAVLELEGDDPPELGNRLDALETAGHPVIRIRLKEPYDLGEEIFRWEIGVASAGAVLNVNPFDQPDVETAKELARQAMKKRAIDGGRIENTGQTIFAENSGNLRAALSEWLSLARPDDYIGLQAYLAPSSETSQALSQIRATILERTRLATTSGYGPRFLHSTGQLHKGGPDEGLFLQIVDDIGPEVPVPETDYAFGSLIQAQSLGDHEALRRRGRRVLRIDVGKDILGGLAHIREMLRT